MPATVLLDVEGTLGSRSFVRDVLFPYAHARLPFWLREHGDAPRVAALLDTLRAEAGTPDATRRELVTTLRGWMDDDRDLTPLKTLQGLIWQDGFEQGAFTAHLYRDAYKALKRWHRAGHTLAIYSNGSVGAQRLYVARTYWGDLSGWFSGFFDSEVGPKTDPISYGRICETLGADPPSVLFCSDEVEELDAAKALGLQTVQIARDDQPPSADHPLHTTFDDVDPA